MFRTAALTAKCDECDRRRGAAWALPLDKAFSQGPSSAADGRGPASTTRVSLPLTRGPTSTPTSASWTSPAFQRTGEFHCVTGVAPRGARNNVVNSRRYYWYKSWFMPNTAAYQHVLHLFPHWNWDPAVNASVQVWAYSNANEIELFLNDASQVQNVFNAPARVRCGFCYGLIQFFLSGPRG